jgi:hypothetical protein
MKKTLALIIIILGGFFLYYSEQTISFVTKVLKTENKIVVPTANKYKINYDFMFVKNTTSFTPMNKADLLNIYYTTINSGWNNFSFYCPKKYTLCVEDVKAIANDNNVLSHINNFVHPYNSYNEISTKYNTLGKVTISIDRLYSQAKIDIIETKIDQIISQNINDTMTIRDKIKFAHDYIINNSKYDSARADYDNLTYSSDTAYGVLFEGYGLCSGYTDALAIFLDKFGVKNYKIATDSHIWNFINVDNGWYHIDASWDDPVSSDKRNILDYTFYMLDTSKLESIPLIKDHNFDKTVYLEAK